MNIRPLGLEVNATKNESTTPNHGSQFSVRIKVSGDENKTLHDII